jgi:predicted PurR-regulated permease PerM
MSGIIKTLLSFIPGVGPVIQFMESPLGKITLWVGSVAFAILILFCVYKSWESSIKTQVLAQANQARLEQVIKDQQDFMGKMALIAEFQKQSIDSLNDASSKIDSVTGNIGDYLKSPEVKKLDRESSPILKEVIKRLKAE